MDKTIADKLVYIPKDDTQNYPSCGLKLVVETLGHYERTIKNFIKVPKVVNQTNKKR